MRKKNQKAAGVYVDVGNVRKHDRSRSQCLCGGNRSYGQGKYGKQLGRCYHGK